MINNKWLPLIYYLSLVLINTLFRNKAISNQVH